jgi:prophage regulatory protein
MFAEMLETGTVVERRVLRLPEVEARIGFKRSHIYNLMNAGQFPKAKRIGVRTVGWDSAEVDQWITERLADPVGSGKLPCE